MLEQDQHFRLKIRDGPEWHLRAPACRARDHGAGAEVDKLGKHRATVKLRPSAKVFTIQVQQVGREEDRMVRFMVNHGGERVEVRNSLRILNDDLAINHRRSAPWEAGGFHDGPRSRRPVIAVRVKARASPSRS